MYYIYYTRYKPNPRFDLLTKRIDHCKVVFLERFSKLAQR